MKKKGWIKLHRRELEWMEGLSDPEFRYYISARLLAVWDKRNTSFGTLDARTEVVRSEMNLDWASGKINSVKRELIKKGLLKQLGSFRIQVTNANIFLGKGPIIETMIRSAEANLQCNERDIQTPETIRSSIANFQKEFINKNKVS